MTARAAIGFAWVGDVTHDERCDFWLRVKAKDSIRPCWEWAGAISGYGRFVLRGRNVLAHRLSYFLAYGVDPGGSHVLHSCDNEACVNPRHLRLGTSRENGRDRLVTSELLGMFRRGVGVPVRQPRPALTRHHPSRTGHPGHRRHGEDHPKAKMYDAGATAIRRAYWTHGAVQPAIAYAFGVPVVTVSNVLRRGSFRHLPRVEGEPDLDTLDAAISARSPSNSDRAKASWAARKAAALVHKTTIATNAPTCDVNRTIEVGRTGYQAFTEVC